MKEQERRELDQVGQPVVYRRRMHSHFAASNSPFRAPVDLCAYCNLWIQTSTQDSVANDLRIVAELISKAGGATSKHCVTHRRMTCMRIP